MKASLKARLARIEKKRLGLGPDGVPQLDWRDFLRGADGDQEAWKRARVAPATWEFLGRWEDSTARKLKKDGEPEKAAEALTEANAMWERAAHLWTHYGYQGEKITQRRRARYRSLNEQGPTP